jgi:hypothetical protein
LRRLQHSVRVVRFYKNTLAIAETAAAPETRQLAFQLGLTPAQVLRETVLWWMRNGEYEEALTSLKDKLQRDSYACDPQLQVCVVCVCCDGCDGLRRLQRLAGTLVHSKRPPFECV